MKNETAKGTKGKIEKKNNIYCCANVETCLSINYLFMYIYNTK